MTGPLAPFAGQYRDRLKERGYSPLSAVNMERQGAQMSRWLQVEGLGVAEMSESRIDAFVGFVRAGGCGSGRSQLSRPGLLCLLELLRELGVVPPPVLATRSLDEALMDSFERYLLSERGLAAGTVAGYVAHGSRFVAGLDPGGLGQVKTADVTAAVLGRSEQLSVSGTQNFVAGLRAFLRFCFVEALIEVSDSRPVEQLLIDQ